MLRCEWVPGTWIEKKMKLSVHFQVVLGGGLWAATRLPDVITLLDKFWGRLPHLIFTFYGNLTLRVVRSLRQTGTMHMTNRQRNKHNEQSPTINHQQKWLMNRLVNILTSEARLREFYTLDEYIYIYIYNVWLDCGKTIGFITPYRLSKVDSFQLVQKCPPLNPWNLWSPSRPSMGPTKNHCHMKLYQLVLNRLL